MRGKILLATICGLAAMLALMPTGSKGAFVPEPAVDIQPSKVAGNQTAVLAGGCFWCTEAVFEQLKGVQKVTSGFAGGDAATADYRLVSEGKTGHAESIEIVYDPAVISYGQLLRVFFAVAHDPTQLNRQGPDWGRQYRSAIFYKDAEQKRIAESYVAQLNTAKVFGKPIVTEVVEFKGFYPAEAYHQDFVKRNPMYPYVVVNSLPKLRKLSKEFPELVTK